MSRCLRGRRALRPESTSPPPRRSSVETAWMALYVSSGPNAVPKSTCGGQRFASGRARGRSELLREVASAYDPSPVRASPPSSSTRVWSPLVGCARYLQRSWRERITLRRRSSRSRPGCGDVTVGEHAGLLWLVLDSSTNAIQRSQTTLRVGSTTSLRRTYMSGLFMAGLTWNSSL
jgi:hypothetical protein